MNSVLEELATDISPVGAASVPVGGGVGGGVDPAVSV